MKVKHIKHYKILGFTFFFLILILPLLSYTIQISSKQDSQIIGSKDFDEKREVLPKTSYWDDYVDDHVSGGLGSTMFFERMTLNNDLYATLEEEYISGINAWGLSQTYRFNDINYFHEVEYLCIDVAYAFNAPLAVYGGLSTSSMHYIGQISFAGETDFYITDWLTGSPFYIRLGSPTEEDNGPYYIRRIHIVYDGAISPPGTPVLDQPTTPDYDGIIDLSWSIAEGEEGYRIYRDGANVHEVGAGVTSWTDSVSIAATYEYYIQAYNAGGTSDSNIVSVEVRNSPGTPVLDQPTTPDYDGIIHLFWSIAGNEDGYRIYRNGANVHEVGAGVTIWTDSVSINATYEYYIQAFNEWGTSDSNIVSVEVVLCQIDWYESNENYNIGDFPINEWSGNEDKIDVVMASTYGVDMTGKVIRLESVPLGAASMDRFKPFTIDSGQSLYLSFKAQLNKEYSDSEATILLVGQSGLTFLDITFNSLYERIDIEIAGGQEMVFNNLILNQVYDFDIMFIKDPTTNKMKYLIFIDQQLEFLTEVNTALYPLAAYIELVVPSGGTEEFFIDNFFLGHVKNSITLQEDTTIAYPLYYLFPPELTDPADPYDHVNSMNIKFRYDQIILQNLKFSFSAGLSVFSLLGIHENIPIGDVIQLSGGPDYYYEVATSTEDLIVFFKIDGDISNITFYLPGIEPDSGVSEITGMYKYNFLSEHITSYTIPYFNETFGSLPQNYDDCKRSGNAVFQESRTIQAGVAGAQLKYYDIETVDLDYSWVYSWGISLAIPIPYTPFAFNFGISFITEYTNTFDSTVSLGINWDNGVQEDTIIKYDLYAPPEETYSPSLNIAPYSVQQIKIVYPVPTKVTGLTATPGQGRIDLSWTANPESDIENYKIYRNGVLIATTAATSYANTGLPDSTTYTYRVSAVNFYGEEGPQSDPRTATTKPPEPGFTESILIFSLAIGLTIVLLRFNAKLKKPIQPK